MKHIFIINPSAGPVDSSERILKTLNECARAYDYEVYRTSEPGDATRFVREWIARNHTEARFYACGGDGTLNEVVNGAAGHDYISVGCYPCGSGNDYVKYFGGKELFLDLESLMGAPDVPVDLMKVNDRFCINVCSFGFDTAVARTMTQVRRKKIIGGKLSYTTGIVKALIKSMRTRCRVKADGIPISPGKLLLCTLANGSYVGSAFKCAPYSVNDDGLMEVCLVKPISRLRLFTLISTYIKGTHISKPGLKKHLVYCRAKEVEIHAPSGFAVTLDGEIVESNHFSVVNHQRALRFAVPRSAPAKEIIPA